MSNNENISSLFRRINFNDDVVTRLNFNNNENNTFIISDNSHKLRSLYEELIVDMYNNIRGKEITLFRNNLEKIKKILEKDSSLINFATPPSTNYNNDEDLPSMTLLYMSLFIEYALPVNQTNRDLIKSIIKMSAQYNYNFVYKHEYESELSKDIFEIAIEAKCYYTILELFNIPEIYDYVDINNIQLYYSKAHKERSNFDSKSKYILGIFYVYTLFFILIEYYEQPFPKNTILEQLPYTSGKMTMISELIYRREYYSEIPYDFYYDIFYHLLKNGEELDKSYVDSISDKFNIFYHFKRLNTVKYIEEEEYKKTMRLLKSAMAIQLILGTPYTLNIIDVTSVEDKISQFDGDEKMYMREELMKKNCIRFLKYKNRLLDSFFKNYFNDIKTESLDIEKQKIDSNDVVTDMITLEEQTIRDFLAEDRDNHIVLRNYDSESATFLINIEDIKKAIEIDCMPIDLEFGEINENSVKYYDFENPKIVPGPLKKGSRAIVYQCNSIDIGLVDVNSVNNLEPFFDFKSVGGYGGLIPLLELYNTIIIPDVTERGQYFSYKLSDTQINPLAAISIIRYDIVNSKNRFGGQINYTSAAHCQEGQYGNKMTVFQAEEKKMLGGKRIKSKKNRKKRSKRRNKKKRTRKRKYIK